MNRQVKRIPGYAKSVSLGSYGKRTKTSDVGVRSCGEGTQVPHLLNSLITELASSLNDWVSRKGVPYYLTLSALLAFSALGGDFGPPDQTEKIEAASGNITAPFFLTNGCICQAVQTTDIKSGGLAIYEFTIDADREYAFVGLVNNPSKDSEKSFFIAVDEEPTSLMRWDVAPTIGFEEQTITYASVSNTAGSQPRAKFFHLKPGKHVLRIRGNGANVRLDSLTLITPPHAPDAPTGLRIIAFGELPLGRVFDKLRDQDSTVRWRARQNLSQADLSGYIPELAMAMTNIDLTIRRFAAHALCKLGAQSYRAAPALANALADTDYTLRADSATALGELGPSAAFAVPALATCLKDDYAPVRASAAEALGKVGDHAAGALAELAEVLYDKNPDVRDAAIRALGKIGGQPMLAIAPLTAILTRTTDESERKLIIQSLSEVAKRAQDMDTAAALLPLQDALSTLSMLGLTNSPDFQEIHRAVKYLSFLPDEAGTQSGIHTGRQKIAFETAIPQEFAGLRSMSVNGREYNIEPVAAEKNTVYFLGGDNPLSEGVNWLQAKRGAMLKRLAFWYEERQLKQYRLPYTNSYAIIAAIDDYDHVDRGTRGDSGCFGRLPDMVKNAKALAKVLQRVGFPKENILEFYNSKGTAENINSSLERFWQRPDGIKADRLLFYFGGHGTTNSTSPCLVTWNYDSAMPTLSGILMSDIVGRHAQNITAHHFIAVIDACYAGLALPQYQIQGDEQDRRLKEFRALSVIEAETKPKARNLLVSGTASQKALCVSGGIFTQAVVDGLSGLADSNNDGIIQFEELLSYVKKEVIAKARELGEEQVPRSWSDTAAGSGSVVFVREVDQRHK